MRPPRVTTISWILFAWWTDGFVEQLLDSAPSNCRAAMLCIGLDCSTSASTGRSCGKDDEMFDGASISLPSAVAGVVPDNSVDGESVETCNSTMDATEGVDGHPISGASSAMFFCTATLGVDLYRLCACEPLISRDSNVFARFAWSTSKTSSVISATDWILNLGEVSSAAIFDILI